MKYFHKSVGDYMKAFKEEQSDKRLERLADKVLVDVEHTINPSASAQKKLNELHIKHRQTSVDNRDRGTREKKILQEIYGVLPSRLKWTIEDITILKANWKNFCKKYGLDNPFWFINVKRRNQILDDKKLYRFKLYLSCGIKNRSLYTIYDKWILLICTPKTGKLSEAELSLVQKLMCRCKEDELEDVLVLALQRKEHFLRRKIKEFNNVDKTEPIEIDWTLSLEEELVTCLAEELEAKSLEEMDRSIHNWQMSAVTKKLDKGLSQLQVYNHWHYSLHPALMVQQWFTRGELQIKLIKRLMWLVREGKVNEWKQVDWNAVGKFVGGFGSLFVIRQVMTMRWNYLHSKNDRSSIHETVKVFKNEALPRIRKREANDKGKYLRRLVYDWDSMSLSELQRPALNFTGMKTESS